HRHSGTRSTTWSNRAWTRSPGSSVIGRLRPARLTLAQLPGQPGAGVAPLALKGTDRPADDAGRLVKAQPGVVAEHDQLGQGRPGLLEPLNRLVQRQQVSGRRLDQGQALGQLDALPAAAVFLAGLAAGLLDEDLAHGPRRRPEEMALPFPAGVLFPH